MDRRRDLITLLENLGAGQAEFEESEPFLKSFYPVPEHLRAFDPDVVLIVGPRGSGKSSLYRAVIKLGLLRTIAAYSPQRQIASMVERQIEWREGYPLGTGFPDPGVLQSLLNSNPEDRSLGTSIWQAYLVRILYDQLDEESRSVLRPLAEAEGFNPEAVLVAMRNAGIAAQLALDRLDQRLDSENRYISIGYDALDTLGAYDWKVMSLLVGDLVALWASQGRRWKRIRAKIFLRSDLFERSARGGGPDLLKLAANRVEISWSNHQIYAMLIKRIANRDRALLEYCKDAGIICTEDPQIGIIPVIRSMDDAEPFVDRLIGEYMGPNWRKGRTVNWLINHLQDGKGRLVPRPFVRLMEISATRQRESGQLPDHPHLIAPTYIRRGVDEVSREHERGAEGEWPWLAAMARALEGKRVPLSTVEMKRIIGGMIEVEGKKGSEIALPAQNSASLIDYLIDLGVFRVRSDERIDVTDLYLAGLGLKRKGGVRKR